MKLRIETPCLLCVLAAFFASTLVNQVPAQTFKTLHRFTGTDGSGPYHGLLAVSGNSLFGTTFKGGQFNLGTVFTIQTDGTGFRTLHSFTGLENGEGPAGGLVVTNGTIYGTTKGGIEFGVGIVFALDTDGSGFTNLYTFTGGSDGSNCYGGLVLRGNSLFGTAASGGDFDWGAVFSVNTDGSGFTTLYSFSGTDGGRPWCDQFLSRSNSLFGTTARGGSSDDGTLFAINADGTGFTNFYSFTAQDINASTNVDGAVPTAGLMSSGDNLYGASVSGGSGGRGTIFKIRSDGTGFTTLYSFSALSGPALTNHTGADPNGGLVLYGNKLYGTTSYGGTSGNGTVFAINTDGSGFTTIHTFSGAFDGANPWAGLVLSGTTLYGTTMAGGISGNGTVFSITLPSDQPQLTIASSGQNVVLSWPTNFNSFTLQSTTDLASGVWATNLLAPVAINGQYTVTNPAFGTQQFYRFAQ